jgi:hypothetical protein
VCERVGPESKREGRRHIPQSLVLIVFHAPVCGVCAAPRASLIYPGGPVAAALLCKGADALSCCCFFAWVSAAAFSRHGCECCCTSHRCVAAPLCGRLSAAERIYTTWLNHSCPCKVLWSEMCPCPARPCTNPHHAPLGAVVHQSGAGFNACSPCSLCLLSGLLPGLCIPSQLPLTAAIVVSSAAAAAAHRPALWGPQGVACLCRMQFGLLAPPFACRHIVEGLSC